MNNLINYEDFATAGLESCRGILAEMITEARDEETRNGLLLEMGKIAYQLVIKTSAEEEGTPGVPGQPFRETH